MPAGTLGTGVTGGYELQCEHWESNLGLLEEQLLPLTAEPSLPSSSTCLPYVIKDTGDWSDVFVLLW